VVLAVLAAISSACSGQSSSSQTSGAPRTASTTTGSTPELATGVTLAPNVTAACEDFPTQTVPSAVDQDQIAQVTVLPWPEGPIAAFGQPGASYPSEWSTAFEQAKAAITLPLPRPIAGCCSTPGNFVLQIQFASGAEAKYGPCELPGDLATIAATLYDAAF